MHRTPPYLTNIMPFQMSTSLGWCHPGFERQLPTFHTSVASPPCPFPHSSHLDFFLEPAFYKKKIGLMDLEIFNVNKGLSVTMHILIKKYKSLDSDPLPKHQLH
jgi:hypothetical protein